MAAATSKYIFKHKLITDTTIRVTIKIRGAFKIMFALQKIDEDDDLKEFCEFAKNVRAGKCCEINYYNSNIGEYNDIEIINSIEYLTIIFWSDKSFPCTYNLKFDAHVDAFLEALFALNGIEPTF